MKHETPEKILQVLVPAGVTPSKRGIVISDRDALEIISGCCGNFIRFLFDTNERERNWYCVECGALSDDRSSKKTPQSCMRMLKLAKKHPNVTDNWISAWVGVPVEDIEVHFLDGDA